VAFGDQERLGCLFLLLIAGIDTTASALGSALWHCARNPADWEWLRRDPAIIPSAVEELLRMFAPTTVTRTATEPVDVGGHRIRAGEPLLIMLPCANRDDEEFPDAETVLLDRSPNRHLAFGFGTHRCLGAGLARMEMQVALEALTGRIEALSPSGSEPVVWKKGPIRGPKNLPLQVRWSGGVPAAGSSR
jgi:cytochrome P450